MSYTLGYVLGRRQPSGKKAILGSIVHKGLELLARKKLAIQEGNLTFTDEELQETFDIYLDEDAAITIAWKHYSEKEIHHRWFPGDFRQCRGWLNDTLTLNGGMWNPMNRHVVQPEQYFDIELKHDWARYDYVLPNGKRLSGRLAIKGTVDLITQVSPGVLEYQDYKTGKRIDWATGEEKTYEKLREDPQLRIYHYALSRLYPDIKDIVMTIIYIADGGAFSLPFSREDLPKTEEMLRKRFEVIKNTQRPRLNKSWRCTSFCHYGKTNYVGPDGNDSGRTICEHFNSEFAELGLDRVMKKYANVDEIGRYGEGGGSSNRDEKEKKNA